MALAAPTSSWPTASWARPTARDHSPVARSRSVHGGHAVAGHLDETEARIHPLHRPQVRSAVVTSRVRSPPPYLVGTTTTARRGVGWSRGPGWTGRLRRSHRVRATGPEPAARLQPAAGLQPEGGAEDGLERRTGGVRRALEFEEQGDRRPGVLGERFVPSQLIEREVERRAGVRLACVAGCSVRRAPARRRPSAVRSEVEQSAGDDVPLDLGGSAVDGGRPRVEELAPPPSPAWSSPTARIRPEPVVDEVEDRLFGGGHQHLVDGGLGAEVLAARRAGTAWPGSGPAGRRGAGRPRPRPRGRACPAAPR